MEPLRQFALDLMSNLESKDIKEIKSYVGLVELSCDIVEETCQRAKKAGIMSDSNYKKQLSMDILGDLFNRLNELGLVNEKLNNIINNINLEEIEDLVDDIISIWNDAKTITLKLCYGNKRKIRKYQHLQIKKKNSKPYSSSTI